MKCAKDYRSEALYALDGRWKLAMLAYFIASLFGVSYSVSTRIEIHLDKIESPSFAVALLLVALALVLISAIVKVGYIRFNLDLHLRQPKLGTFFSFFPHWGKAIGASLLVGLYTLLWSLLLFVPGIIASYSYAMVPYILADHPDYSVDEAIEASKDIMSGNRWRLFCLDISFIGWDLLCILTLGIGNLWLGPYRAAAFAAFYWDISPPFGSLLRLPGKWPTLCRESLNTVGNAGICVPCNHNWNNPTIWNFFPCCGFFYCGFVVFAFDPGLLLTYYSVLIK